MKRINAYGGRALLWNTGGEGWYYEYLVNGSFQPPRQMSITTGGGKPLFVSTYGSSGFGYATSMQAARRHAVSALRHST